MDGISTPNPLTEWVQPIHRGIDSRCSTWGDEGTANLFYSVSFDNNLVSNLPAFDDPWVWGGFFSVLNENFHKKGKPQRPNVSIILVLSFCAFWIN